MKRKYFLFKFWAIFMFFLSGLSGSIFAQQKQTNPDGVELPDWVLDWQVKYNVQLISNADITLHDDCDDCVCQPQSRESAIVKIERNRKETLITIKTPIYWDWNWLFQDKKTCLIDTKTGNRYMMRDILGVHQPGRLAAVYGLKGKTVLRTLVFPPLKKNVKIIDFCEPTNFIDAPQQHNSGGYREYGIVLDEYTKYNNPQIIY
jgi:hypothetical protein